MLFLVLLFLTFMLITYITALYEDYKYFSHSLKLEIRKIKITVTCTDNVIILHAQKKRLNEIKLNYSNFRLIYLFMFIKLRFIIKQKLTNNVY